MQKPDFSGDWTLNREASALSPVVAPVVQGGFVKIEHREPTVSVHLSIKMDGDRIPTPHGEMTIVFRYELQEGGRRLRAAEQLRAPDREQDNVWVFDSLIIRRSISSGVSSSRMVASAQDVHGSGPKSSGGRRFFVAAS